MKYLIIGRTSTGKDTLADILYKDYDMTTVLSCTTRKPRSNDDASHIFVSEEQAKRDEPDKVAKTVIDSNEYYSTKEAVNSNDLYIIDPNGMYDLCEKMPDEFFTVIYTCARKCNQQDNFVARLQEDNPISREDAIEEFNKRYDAEDEQFKEFETKITRGEGDMLDDDFPKNVVAIFPLENDYNYDTLKHFAKTIYTNKRALEKLISIMPQAIAANIVKAGDEPNTIETVTYSDTKAKSMPTEYVVSQLLTDPKALSTFLVSLLLVTDVFEKDDAHNNE